MAIAHRSPIKPVIPETHHSVSQQPSEHAVYDNHYDPAYSLEAYLQGSPWTTMAYYRQILGKSDMPKDLDIHLTAGYQHYEKIEKLELLVQSALSSSFDNKSQIASVTGSAILYSFIRPNVSDYFIAESNIGRLGLFKITQVARKTFQKESIHEVEYHMVEEITLGHPKVRDLEAKVSLTKVFDKSRLIENLNPVLLKDTHSTVKNLHGELKMLALDYWRSFYRPERGTFMVPGQDRYIYDPYVVDFFCKVIDRNILPQRYQLSIYSEDDDPVYEGDTIWKVLELRGLERLKFSMTKMMLIPPDMFDQVTLSKGAYFANADFYVYPYDINRTAEINNRLPASGFSHYRNHEYVYNPTNRQGDVEKARPFALCPSHTSDEDVDRHLEFQIEIAAKVYPVWNKINQGETYLFAEKFYKGQPESLLEIVLMDYIGRRMINAQQLQKVLDHWHDMGRVEQFYYGPMLFVLIKECLRGAYA